MRAFRRRVGWLVAVAAVVAGPFGCRSGDEVPRESVSGTVEFQGKPLAKGSIQFQPAEASEFAVTAGAPIQNGSYSIPRAEGLAPGKYKVMISAAGAMPTKPSAAEKVGDMPGLGPLNAEELIPTKYNAETTLTAEVKKGGPNQFDYKLTK